MSSPSKTASTSTSRPRRYLSTSSGAPGRIGGARLGVRRELAFVVDDLHRRARPARTTGARAPGSPVRARSRALRGNSSRRGPRAVRRRGAASAASNCSRSSAMSSARAVAADDAHAAAAQFGGEIDRRLPAERQHHARGVGRSVGGFDFVGARRLEDQHVGDVEIGRDRFGIVVDDDGGAAGGAQRPRRVHARVIELDALADADRPAADDDDGFAVGGAHLVLLRRATDSSTANAPETRRRRYPPCGSSPRLVGVSSALPDRATLRSRASAGELDVASSRARAAAYTSLRVPLVRRRSSSATSSANSQQPERDRSPRPASIVVDAARRGAAASADGEQPLVRSVRRRRASSSSSLHSANALPVSVSRSRSSPRTAFISAAPKVRADAHRFAGRLHLRSRAACRRSGNLSNGQRGIFDDARSRASARRRPWSRR